MLLFHGLMLSNCFTVWSGWNLTPKKDKRGGERWVLHSKEARKALAEKGQRPPSPVHHPSPAKRPLPTREEEEKQVEEAEKLVEEARRLEDVGRSLSSLPTWQLAQMAVEAGPSTLGQEEALTDCGRQSPPEGIPPGWKGKEDHKVLAWHSCFLGDLTVLKEHWAPHQETPLLTVSPWGSPWSGQIWLALPRKCHYMPAGSCRSICDWSHGRCQPLCHICKKGDNFAQGYSVSPLHPGRASTILKNLPTGKSVGCRLCGVFVYFLVQGKGT